VAAKNPNVYLETSGMPMHSKIREAVERVGPDRVLSGSDTPFHHPSVGLTQVRVSGLPADLTDRVLGENGRRLFFGDAMPESVA
jgi:predicted TIM-barrel fold metal-dependent hydrolase